MICRLCLEETNSNFEIFSEHGETEIAKVIAKYFHIEVQPDDTISNIICGECFRNIFEFHRFWLSIDEKQKTLQTHLVCTQIKQDVDEIETQCFATSHTNSSIDCKNNELREPEIDMGVVQPNICANGLEFVAAEMKDDEISMDRDSILSPLNPAIDECEPVSLASLQKELREMRSDIRESRGEIKTTLRDLESKVERNFKDFEKKMPERAESQVQGQLMREVKVVMTRVHQSIARITGDALSPEYIKIQSMLPITSQDAINTLEELLNTKSYSEAMLNILLKLRGAKGCIKGVMKRVYSDELMFHYNFEGKANKSALLDLKSLELIFDTFNSTPKSEVIAEIRKAVLMSHNRYKQVVRKQKQKINIQNIN